MFSKKTLLISFLFLLILFSGCNQKLSEEQLEEKAKECFYSLDDVTVESYVIKAEYFYLKESTPSNTSEWSWETMCNVCQNHKNAKGLCEENLKECKSFNGNINNYEFELKEDIKEDINLPREIWPYGTVFLKDNGEPLGCFFSAYIVHYEDSEMVVK